METEQASAQLRDLTFKSHRCDPLARLIIDRFRLTPIRLVLAMVGVTALLYGLTAGLYATFYPSGVLDNFLVWASRSWAQLVWLFVPPGIIGFYCWMNIGIGQLFDGLVKDRVVEASDEKLYGIVIGGKGSIQEEYNRRAWVIGSVLVVILVVLLSVVRPGFYQAVGGIGSDIVVFNIVMLPFVALQVYVVSMMTAKEVTTIRSLKRLFSHTVLNLRPLHPDRCGGLERLHNYAIRVNYAIALAGLGICLLAYLSFEAGHLWNNYLLHFWLGVYLVIAPYSFFAKLGTAHQAMKATKESFLNQISEQFQGAYTEIQEQLSSRHGEFGVGMDRIEQIRQLHRLTQSFPVWPFDVRSIRRFATTVVAPLLSTAAAGIIDRFL